jgi:hypothetical protein
MKVGLLVDLSDGKGGIIVVGGKVDNLTNKLFDLFVISKLIIILCN